ncbi:MAG: TIGR03790 family protein [Rubrivivax sp.]|nr:TIGR03790 family protein [Rubrivivax sp.]
MQAQAPSPGSASVWDSAPGTRSESLVPAVQAPPWRRYGLQAADLALVVAEGDALSEAVAQAYQQAHGVPARNVVRIRLPAQRDTISAAEFAPLKAQIDAALPPGAQATLLTFVQPSRVAGSCSMSITSAVALGFDGSRCGGCARTSASAYFDSESLRPQDELGWRPSMMLGANSLDEARALIARGLAAQGRLPPGPGWLVRTADAARSVRHVDWAALPAWGARSELDLRYRDLTQGAGAPQDGEEVMFYFTGLPRVAGIERLNWLPGAVADHLTSFGGLLPNGAGQMTALAWLRAGATGSYGTVEEPCNHTQKFPQASVLLGHYLRGASLIEAYWKSVAWPGQGLFVGDPLARPWADAAVSRIDGQDWVLQTRALRPGARHEAQWRSDASQAWQTLEIRIPAQTGRLEWRIPLPARAGELRLLGPCADRVASTCVWAGQS